MESLYAIILVPLLLGIFTALLLRWRQEGMAAELQRAVAAETGAARRTSLRVFSLAILWRIAVFCLMLAIITLLAKVKPVTLEDTLSNWDAWHYIRLIEDGYSNYIEDGKHLFLVFFPLYVWVCRPIYWLTGSAVAAGLLCSFTAYGAGCVFVHKWVGSVYGNNTARHAVLYLSVFPFSFFFGCVMTEGLFLLTTAAALYYIHNHKWLQAGIWGALAALTRMTGLLLAAAVLIELLSSAYLFSREGRSKRIKAALRHGYAVLLPMCGSLCYLLLNWYVDGDPFAFLTHQAHWYQGAGFLPDVFRLITEYLRGTWGDEASAAIWGPAFILFFLCIGLLILGIRQKTHRAYLLGYGFLYFISVYSLSWPLSIGRYLSCGLPFFVFAGEYTARHPLLNKCVTACLSVTFGIYFFAYISGAGIM